MIQICKYHILKDFADGKRYMTIRNKYIENLKCDESIII